MFQIHLVTEKPFWHPGDWLEGVVTLAMREPRSVTGVRLKLKGREHTHWSESSGKNRRTYDSKLISIHTVLTLWGFPRGSSHKQELPAGLYVWPFRIALPEVQLPASLEADGGSVRYKLIAYVDIPFAPDIVFKQLLQVIPILPLDSRPDLFAPQALEEHKAMTNYCCVSNGSIDVTASCSVLGFLPGDVIPIGVQVVNNSGADISAVRAKIEEHVELYADGHHRHREEEVAAVAVQQPIRARSGRTNMQLDLSIPPRPIAPSFNGKYIQRAYQISVRAIIDETLTRDVRIHFTAVGGSSRDSNYPPPDTSPSIFNPSGALRQKTLLPVNDGLLPAPICVDGLDYNPIDQTDIKNCVCYPTFYTPDFTIPQTLWRFNQPLYQFLVSLSTH